MKYDGFKKFKNWIIRSQVILLKIKGSTTILFKEVEL